MGFGSSHYNGVGSMGILILTRQLLRRRSRAELESLLVQRTVALQRLSQQLLKVQDEERRKVARDLHDATGQTLAALKMAVASLECKLQEDQDAADVLSDIAALTDQALKEIRTTSYLLHPPLLDEIGFTAAAKWYVEGFAERSGIKASLDFARGPERLSIEIETALFRVLQEGLTNVHRYSGSSKVSVCFQHRADGLVLEIADRGCGISAELLQRLREGSAETGVGLAGMRERLDELNGTLEISSDGSGTTLRAIVPLTSPITTKNQLTQCRVYGPVAASVVAKLSARSASL
jgi:two-component system NarL family sensor kinase